MKKRLLSLLLCCFVALAAHSGVTYILNEGFESGIPATWSQAVVSANTQNWVAENSGLTYPTGAFEGNGRVALRNTTGTTQDYVTRLITPVMNLPYGSQYVLKFAYASASNAGDVDSLTVFYSTDGTRWQKHTGYGAQQNSWKEVTLDLIGNGATYQLAFEGFDKQGRGVVLDAVRVFKKSECSDIENFAADAHANSVDLSWTGDFGATFQLIVDTVSHNLASLSPDSAYLHYEASTNDQVTVSGLTPEKQYYAYVRSTCDDNESGYTEWQAVAFATAVGFPYSANFSTAIPAGWQNLYGKLSDAFAGTLPLPNASSYLWKYTNNTTVTGQAHVVGQVQYTYSSGAAIYTPSWLVTPAIDISSLASGSAIELSLRLAISSSSSSSSDLISTYQATTNFYVLVSTDGGQSWAEANKHVYPATEYLSAARRIRLNLSEFVGVASSLQFAFVAESSTTGAYFHLDDVSLHEYNTQCGDASNLKVVASDIDATATWNVSGKDSVVIQLSKASTFATLLVNDTLTAHTYSFSNLTPSTVYYARVKQLCVDAEWVVKSFQTGCGVPFAPTFTSTFPSDWTRLKGTAAQFFADSCTSTTSGWSMKNNQVFTPYHFKANIYGTAAQYWFISPAVYLNPNAADHVLLTFDLALTKYNGTGQADAVTDDRFWVVISEDGGDTWTRANATLWSADANDNPDYNYSNIATEGEKISISLDSYIGHNIKVAFGGESYVSNGDNDLHVANIAIKAYDPACVGLEKLIASAGVNDAVINWVIGGTTHQAKVQVSTAATFATLLADTAINGVDTFAISGLEANTKYYVRAWQNCAGFTADDALSLSFKTHCADEAIPYVNDFESETSLQDPQCWTIVRDASVNYPCAYQGSSYAHNGNKSLYYGTTSAQKASIVALPAFNVPVNTLEMSFWLRAYNASCTNTLEVGVMTNPLDESTFVRIASFSPKSTTYEQQTVGFNSYQGTGKYIVFRNPATGNYGFCIDEVDVHALPTCFGMGEVEVQNITGQGATLLFAPTNATNYQVVAATQSINIDSLATAAVAAKVVYNQTVDGSTGSIVLDDATVFAANTTYYIYVRGACSATEFGAWSHEVSFLTECKPFTPAEFGEEDFSDASVMACWKTGFTTVGSSTYSAKAQRATVTKYGNVLQLTKESANTSTTTYSDGAYAITPEFAVGDTINKYQITFTAATSSTSATNVHKLIVAIAASPTDLSTKTDIQTLNLPYAADSTSMKEYSISFENYMGDYMGNIGRYVMFQSVAGEDSTNYVLIDNVRLEPISSCKKVNEIAVSAITEAGATFSWDNTGAAQYQLIVDTLSTKNVAAIAAPIYTTIVSSDSAVVTGLQGNTQYYAYVRGICAAGDTALWSAPAAFKTECGAVTTFPWTENFDSQNTGDLSIDCWTNEQVVGSSYFMQVATSTSIGNSTKMMQLKDQTAGNITRVSLPYMEIPAANAYEFRMDMYRNNTYTTKVNEGFVVLCESAHGIDTIGIVPRVISVSNDYVDAVEAAGWYTYGFTIPAAGGLHIVLHGISEYGNPSYADNFEVRALPTCPAPKHLSVYNTTMNGATAKWEGTSNSYEIQIYAGDAYVTTISNIAADSAVITGLDASTTYTLNLRGICSGTDSTTAISATFATAFGLPLIEDFNSITSGIPAGWDNEEGTTSSASYRWSYWATGESGACVRFNSYSNTSGKTNVLATPSIAFGTVDSVLFSFSYKNPTGGDFYVTVGTDDTNVRDTLFSGLTDQSTWRTLSTGLSRYSGKNVTVYFNAVSNYGNGDAYIYLDNVSIRSINVNCMEPEAEIASVGTDSIVLKWNGDATDTFMAQISRSAAFATDVDSVTVTDTMVVFRNLTPATNYYLRVKKICGAGETSPWSAKVNTLTDCVPTAVPFAVDFAKVTDIPVCWTTVQNNPSSVAYPQVWTSSQALVFYGGGAMATSGSLIALPELSSPISSLTLKLEYKSTVGADYGNLVVGTMSSLDKSSFVECAVLDKQSAAAEEEVVLANAPADAKYIAFRYSGGSYSSGYAYIYNVDVDLTPACNALRSIEAQDVSRRSFDLTWTPKVASPAYDVVVADHLLTDSALAVASVTTVDTTFLHVENLMRNTTYHAYVRANCGAEDGFGPWMHLSVKTKELNFCEDYIVANGTTTSSNVPVYGYYTDDEQKTQSIYPASMLTELIGQPIRGLHYYVTSGSNAGKWDNSTFVVRLLEVADEIFTSAAFNTDAKTQVYSGYLTANTTDDMVIEFDQPYIYRGGNLLIEFEQPVASSYASVTFAAMSKSGASLYGYNSSWSGYSCNSHAYLPKVGFNYCVTLDPCPAVDSISHALTGDGTSSALIKWTASEGDYAAHYSVLVSDTLVTNFDSIVPQVDSIAALQAEVTGLNAYTDYYVYVKAHCDAEGIQDGSSNWSAPYVFKTASTCPVIENLSFEATGKSAALATWSAPYADKNFVYVLSTSKLSAAALDAASTTAVTDTFVQFPSLNLDQTYYLYVAHSCGAEGVSPYLMDSIHTSASCPAVADLHAVTTTANTVLVAWERAAFGEETEWEVGVVGREAVAQRVNAQQALVIGLEPDMNYTIYVKALCSAEEASALATLAVHTPEMPADEVTVGSATTGSSMLPIGLYYNYSTSEQIYTAAEIGGQGTITSIAFKYNSSTAVSNRDLTIYMKHVSRSSFSTTSDWETLDAGDVVFTGTVSIAANDWHVFDLQNVFDYNGSDNLLVVVDDNTGSYLSSGLSFAVYTGVNNCSLYKTADGENVDPTNPGSSVGTRTSSKNQIKIGFQASACPSVKSLKASDITINSAKISWLPGGAETSWVTVLSATALTDAELAAAEKDTLVYQLESQIMGLTPDVDYHFYVLSLCGNAESQWKEVTFTTLPTCSAPLQLNVTNVIDTAATLYWSNITEGFAGTYRVAFGPAAKFNLAQDSTFTVYEGIADTAFVVNGLKSLTSYSFAVQEVCSATDTSRWSAVSTFTTECGAYAVPWSEDFENAVMDCWSVPTTGVTVYNYATYSQSGTHALKFATTSSIVTVLPSFGNDLNGLRLRYSYRNEGTNTTSGYFEAGYVTDAADTTTFVSMISTPQIFEYTEVEVLYRSAVPAGARPAIRYSKATSSSWYGFIDDVRVDSIPNCAKPMLAVDSATVNSIILHADVVADYFVQIASDANFLSVVDSLTVQNGDTIAFNGLAGASTYYIRAKRVCGASEESEWSATLTQATACSIISSFPWSEDFNTLSAGIPACWNNDLGTMTSTQSTYKWQYYSAGKSGACVRMNSYSATSGLTNYLATPEIVVDTTLVLSFDWKNPTGGAFEVLAAADGGAFTTLATGLTSESSWTKEEIHLDQFRGQTIRIYFKGTSNFGNGDAYQYLDNVTVNIYNANCLGVDSLKISNIGLADADVSFIYLGGANDAVVEVSKSAQFASLVLTDTVRNAATCHIAGLAPSTTYYVRVKQLCGGGDESAYASASFTTNYGVRYTPEFTSTTLPSNWTVAAGKIDEVSTVADLSSGYGWSLTAASAALNAIHLKANVYGTYCNKWIISPSIDLSPNVTDGLVLSFDVALTDYSYTTAPEADKDRSDDRFAVLAIVGDTAVYKMAEWNNSDTADYVYNDIDSVATHYQINFTEFAGQRNVRLAFYCESTVSGADDDIHVGNIVLDRVDAVNYIGDVCAGEDYDGASEGNAFYVHTSEYQVGANHYSKVVNDTIYVLNLTVHEGQKYEYSATICEGETYADDNFNLGVVTLQTNPEQKLKGRYQTAFGCDSTIVLHLTINPIQRVTEQRMLCAGNSFVWNGQTISTVGNYTYEGVAVTGCDSITTLAVKWDAASARRDNVLLCADDTLVVENTTITAPGNYTIDESIDGECDHTLSLHVIAVSAEGSYVDTVNVNDLPYYVGDQLIAAKGTQPTTIYENVKTSCGTTVLLELTIVDGTALENVDAVDTVQKVIIDGHLVIIKNGVRYSALGARLN